MFGVESAGSASHEKSQDTAKISHLVLGGDIFDFRWSRAGGFEKSIALANRWLDQLLEFLPGCRVDYLLGNHDCDSRFRQLLEHRASDTSNFGVHEICFRFEDTLFLHGDVLDAGGFQHLSKYRSAFEHSSEQPWWVHRLYDLAVMLRVHQRIPEFRHRPVPCVQKLKEYLGQEVSVDLSAIQRVFFGHTHVPIRGLQVSGITYWNPGAALKHMPFEPLEF